MIRTENPAEIWEKPSKYLNTHSTNDVSLYVCVNGTVTNLYFDNARISQLEGTIVIDHARKSDQAPWGFHVTRAVFPTSSVMYYKETNMGHNVPIACYGHILSNGAKGTERYKKSDYSPSGELLKKDKNNNE